MLKLKDRLLLRELQKDSRLTMQELAQRVGMSSSACWRRVRNLEESGVIDRYAVIVNPRKVSKLSSASNACQFVVTASSSPFLSATETTSSSASLTLNSNVPPLSRTSTVYVPVPNSLRSSATAAVPTLSTVALLPDADAVPVPPQPECAGQSQRLVNAGLLCRSHHLGLG